MADSIERIADEVATYQAPPNGQYIQVHPRVMRDWESRLRALSPAWGDWVMVPREPTPEMIYAYNTADAAPPNHRNLSTSGYLAMLAASPQQEPGADGCGACGDSCANRGACRLADDSPTRLYALAAAIRGEADIADRPGQMARLNAIADVDESGAGLVGIASIPPGGDGATTRALFDARTVPPGTKLYTSGQTLAGAGGDVVIEAVGRIVADDEMGARVDWLTEGGIAAMEVGDFLCVTNATIPDDGLLTLTATSAGTTGDGEACKHEWFPDPDMGEGSGYLHCRKCDVTRRSRGEGK